jgi:hypothetical protein
MLCSTSKGLFMKTFRFTGKRLGSTWAVRRKRHERCAVLCQGHPCMNIGALPRLAWAEALIL